MLPRHPGPLPTSSLPHAAPSFLLFYLLLAGEFLGTPSRPSLNRFLSCDILQMSVKDVICPRSAEAGAPGWELRRKWGVGVGLD